MKKAIQQAVQRVLRGPKAARLLISLGIDPKRCWLLVDLFDLLSERGGLLDQLGRDGIALQTAGWLYGGLSALVGLALVLKRTSPENYLSTFLGLTVFLLLTVLLSETGNSVVNPTEGIVLAHQPINGATYLAAKLSHLVRIVLYLVVGINAIPALAGLNLPGTGWAYPPIHMAAALATGILTALSCCALYGLLIRLVPARRLKAAGQMAGLVPFLAITTYRPLRELLAHFHLDTFTLPAAAHWPLRAAAGAGAVAIVVFGMRSLTADYLVRVSSLLHSNAKAKSQGRRSWFGLLVARYFGGQPGRAGFAFVSAMARRDYQFRRQVLPLSASGLIGLVPVIAQGGGSDPLSGAFTPIHFLPHLFGAVLFFGCSLIPYGAESTAVWVFLIAPARVFGDFSRGVHAALWIPVIVVPHAILLLIFAWRWGIWHAALFVAFSVAVSSLYLAFELRLIGCVPFSKPIDLTRGAMMLPLMLLFAVVAAAAMGLQYFFVFRSQAVVVTVTLLAGASAYFFTRLSLDAFERSMRYNLGLLSVESRMLYQEIDG